MYPIQLKQRFEQQITFQIQHKEKAAGYLQERLEQSDPKLRYKRGWAQVVKKSKPVSLNHINLNDKFFLEDGFIKLEALCLSKKEI
jgi:exonuclease VII large subunit